MEFIQLNNGIKMPILGLGTFLNNGNSCEEAVYKAIRKGYRLIDTAEAYGNEEAVGNGIKKSGIERKELFIVTKVNFKSYEDTRTALLNSLKKLQLDYIDLLLLHWPFGNYYLAWREFEKLYEEGVVRSIGISNFEPDRMIDLINFNKVVPMVNQIETHLFCQRKIENQWLKKYDVQHMSYAPLGQGKNNKMFDLPEINVISEKYNKTPAQILLRFLTQQGIVVIPKSNSEEHIEENINIFDFKLTDNEMEILKNLDTETPLIGNPSDPELVESAMKW